MFDDDVSVFLLYVFQFGFIALLGFLVFWFFFNVLMVIMFFLIGVRTLGERAEQDEGKEISLEERGPSPFGNVFISLYTKDQGLFLWRVRVGRGSRFPRKLCQIRNLSL